MISFVRALVEVLGPEFTHGLQVNEALAFESLRVPLDPRVGELSSDLGFTIARGRGEDLEAVAARLVERVKRARLCEAHAERGYLNFRLRPEELQEFSLHAPELRVEEFEIIFAPWDGILAPAGYLRFAMFPLWQAMLLRRVSKKLRIILRAPDGSELSQNPQALALRQCDQFRGPGADVGAWVFDWAGVILERTGFASSLWVYEDLSQRDLFRGVEAREKIRAFQRRSARQLRGCDRELLIHTPKDQSLEELCKFSDSSWQDFQWLAISPVLGPEFVPLACAEGISERMSDSLLQLMARARALAGSEERQTPKATTSSLEEPRGKILAKELMVLDWQFELLCWRAANVGEIAEFGAATWRFVLTAQKLLNNPDFRAAFLAAEQGTRDLLSRVIARCEYILALSI